MHKTRSYSPKLGPWICVASVFIISIQVKSEFFFGPIATSLSERPVFNSARFILFGLAVISPAISAYGLILSIKEPLLEKKFKLLSLILTLCFIPEIFILLKWLRWR